MNKGIFISFEGTDGCGKSTQLNLFKEYLEEKCYQVVMTREPGGTPISEQIRDILLDANNKEMNPRTEALLYAASRAQHVEQLIRPSVAEGKIVVSDRFVDSSLAYQAFARGLGEEVLDINDFAIDECYPDLTFFLDLPPQVGMNRVGERAEMDRIELEGMKFQLDVYEGYKQLKQIYRDRIAWIDASGTIEQVAAEIRSRFEEYMAGLNQKEF